MNSTYPPLHHHDLFLSRNDQPDTRSAHPDTADTLSPQPASQLGTPGASTSDLSHYGASDISEFDDDPFFGAEGVVPSFLDHEHPGWDTTSISASHNTSSFTETRRSNATDPLCPLTPDQTASIQSASPQSELTAANAIRPIQDRLPFSISPQELQKPTFHPEPLVTQSSQLTPSQSSSGRSSEDGLAPALLNMPAASPRVTVSLWGSDENPSASGVERSIVGPPSTLRGVGIESAGDLMSSGHEDHQPPTSAPRDMMGRWNRDPFAGPGGLDPQNRPADEGPSINEIANHHEMEERNHDVGWWLTNKVADVSDPHGRSPEDPENTTYTSPDEDDGIPFGVPTENRIVPGQTYIAPNSNGGPMNDQDREILAADRNWENPPMEFAIRSGVPGRYQPETSQDAIQRFERMCRDSDAMSRAATWGTRRRSIHSVSDFDMEGILSGNFLKKLSISRGGDQMADRGNRTGSLLKDLYGFVRRSSTSSRRKRRGSGSGDEIQEEADMPPQEKRDSLGSPLLAPPDRTSSWGKNKNKPNVNTPFSTITNLVTMGSPGATAESRPRKSSFGAVSMTSPKSTLSSLKVNNTLKRPRSRSEAPKPTTATPDELQPQSSLVDLWKMSGGPPVAALSRPSTANYVPAENDDEEDDDDDNFDDNDLKADANLIDSVEANFAGFQSHVLMLNPHLDGQYNYLVDRIAQHQVIRYKTLLNLKVKHLSQGANCPCGELCLALGGQANILDQKGDARGMDPLSTQYLDDDDTGTPTDGTINQDSFPPDIPLPPAQYLPAEFECQLCFSRKKFQKPSDWTKHVHEDVQPFTCTWEKCRDAKSFKRKADWVRHENEGHRQLEWWTCDVDECRHTCYRRDNFLQHLVREHKFPEPKVKTKAAIKKAGLLDPTWQRVEKCHGFTNKQPQHEPCRFCGKAFPTWKKLTVHLAKHMEQVSLPVLRLVEARAKEISADTIISPVRDPPPRPMIPTALGQPMGMGPGNNHQGPPYLPGHSDMPYQNPGGGTYVTYPPIMAPGQPMYPGHYSNVGGPLNQQPMHVGPMNHHGYDQTSGHMQNMPPTPSAYGHSGNQYVTMPGDSNDGGMEPFPTFEALGVHNVPTGSQMGPQMGPQLGYHAMMDQSTASASPFSGQGSASPYTHSPHLHATTTDNGWDERQIHGFR